MKLNKSIKDIITKGRVFSKGKIKIYYLPACNNQLELYFSLSKKLFNAVERNYIKRVVKELLRKNPIPCKILIKVNDKILDYNDYLNFFISFRENLINEKNIDIIDKNL